MLTFTKLTVLLLSASAAIAIDKRQEAQGTASVTLSAQIGAPNHLASGFIYGIPDTVGQIPDEFYTGFGVNYARAGGAQLPVSGYVGGIDGYNVRFESTLADYQTARKFGATFQMLFHDLWGIDGSIDTLHPGDSGNWTLYDEFLTQLLSDINNNDMLDGLELEIWNEPDLTVFWQRSQSQWLDMWNHAYPILKSQLPYNSIVGPSVAAEPGETASWFPAFVANAKANNTPPDKYTYHSEAWSIYDNFGDPQNSVATARQIIDAQGLAQAPIVINEYAVPDEQNPAGATWFISRLERNNVNGLRGNWDGGYELHDYLASLLGKPGAGTDAYSENATGYYPNGEWRLYQYYVTDMVGQRVATTGSADNMFDVYATSDGTGTGVRIITGQRVVEGTWDVTVEALSAVGLPTDGSVNIHTLRFDYTGPYGEVGLPVDLGIVSHDYTNDAVTWWVTPDTNQTAYAFEFV